MSPDKANPDELAMMRKYITDYTAASKGIKSTDLIVMTLTHFSSSRREDVERAISEAVMEKLIVRIEYQIPAYGSRFFAFYLPEGSKTY